VRVHKSVLELVAYHAFIHVIGNTTYILIHSSTELSWVLCRLISSDDLALSFFNYFFTVFSHISASSMDLKIFSFIKKRPSFGLKGSWTILTLNWLIIKASHLTIQVPVILRYQSTRLLIRERFIGGRWIRSFLLLQFSRYKQIVILLGTVLLSHRLSYLVLSSLSSSHIVAKINTRVRQAMTLFHRVPWHSWCFCHLLMISHICSKIGLNCNLNIFNNRIWSWGIHSTQIIIFWTH